MRHCYYLLLIVLGFVVPGKGLGQYEDLLHKTYAQRAPALWRIGDSVFFQEDSGRAMLVANRLMEYGKNHHDAALQLEAELYKMFYVWGHDFTPNKDKIFRGLTDILGRAIDSKAWEVELKTRTLLADYYWEGNHNYEQAMEEYAVLDGLLQTRSYTEYPEKALVMYRIGSAYYDFKDYAKAIQYFRRLPQLQMDARFQRYAYMQSFNKLTIAYRLMGELDSSDHCLHQFYDTCIKYANTKAKYPDVNWPSDDSTWQYIIRGDLGYNASLRGKLAEAIPLLKAAADRGISTGDWDMTVNYLLPLARTYFHAGLQTAATAATLASEAYIKNKVVPERRYQFLKDLYPLLAKMYAARGNTLRAQQYMDSSVLVMDSLDRQFSGLLMARAVQREAITEQKEQQAAQQLLTLKLYIVLALALIGVVATLYVYRTRRHRHRQEQALKETQLEAAAAALQRTKTQLYELTTHMAEKNQLIEKLEAKVGDSKSQALEELDNAVILTEADWRKFRELFEQVHPGYLAGLAEEVPGISPAEMRLMALAKLNFSNKEMAGTLGVSPQAIRVAWHRLRKKQEPSEGNGL